MRFHSDCTIVLLSIVLSSMFPEKTVAVRGPKKSTNSNNEIDEIVEIHNENHRRNLGGTAEAFPCDPFEGTIGPIYPFGMNSATCEVGVPRPIVRYDMLNGFYTTDAGQTNFYEDSCYNGQGDIQVSYTPLMHGKGTLADGNCGGPYTGRADILYDDWVAWNVNNDPIATLPTKEPGQMGPSITVYLGQETTVDVVTLTVHARDGRGRVCSPSGVYVNGQFVDMTSAPEPTEPLTQKLQIFLDETFEGEIMEIEIYQDNRQATFNPCAWIFLGEIELNACVPVIPSASPTTVTQKSKSVKKTKSEKGNDECDTVDESITGEALDYLEYLCTLV